RAQAPAMPPGAAASGLTRHFAEFIVATRYSDLPPEVIEVGKKSILDGLGLTLVGSVAQSGGIVRRYLESLSLGRGEATVAGSGLRLPARFAAFANGIGIHADDYDDTQLAVAPDRVYGLLTHPTAPCLAAALAAAETRNVSGRDLMLAYHIGVEVETKIAEAINPRHYEDGFHSTGTMGPFAAAAAAGKLYGLAAPACARALSIAASQSSGLRENFGTMTKPFHAGHAAESGIMAADLAELGWTASDRILEAPNGFFHAAGGGYDPKALNLAHPWTFASPGVSIKPFPSGSLTHPAMTALLRLIREHHITADQVERVDVGTNRNMPNALIHHHPTDSLQAKFSMEFCMASLLLYGKAGLNEFTDEVVRRPEVQVMIQRVRFGVNAEAEAAGYNKMTSILEIHLKDGRSLSGRADVAKGNPANPMTYDEVAEKFRDGARFAKWPAAKASAIIESVRTLEDVASVRTLAALLGA
ncbi:MAG TPA: MmgE/PrpD family protein, partial [Bryobacteraceae bacterium]|nr:MmgE/PrpD family protein [Bryobacteraceae bacterium]